MISLFSHVIKSIEMFSFLQCFDTVGLACTNLALAIPEDFCVYLAKLSVISRNSTTYGKQNQK